MTIRSRLTWWSAGLMLSGLLLLTGFACFEFVYEHPEFRTGEWTAAKRHAVIHSIKEVGLFAALPALLLGIGGWCWLIFVRRALRPLEALTEAAEQVHIGNLNQPLPRSGNNDEIDRLSAVLTKANQGIAESFDRVREFTLHASHELKTPLTVLRAGLESSLGDSALTASQREEVVERLAELDRLTVIVEGLTFLTKADAQLVHLHREALRLDQLVQDAFEDAQTLAESRSIKVQLLACEGATLSGDRHRVRQLLLNLVDNAVKYNLPGGRIDLGLTAQNGTACFTISNSGPGLSREFQSRVFDRFFRGDSSHNREIEGCGLGLSIARWIVVSHGGEISFSSEPDKITTVKVNFPTSTGTRPLEKDRSTEKRLLER